MPVILDTQEDHGLKPALSKQFAKPYFEETHHKKDLVEWLQGIGPEFKSQSKKKKE
jgi:hypothetical protein